MLDAETCSVQHTRSGGSFLNSFLKELGLDRDSNLLIFNDDKSLCSHIQTTNVHKNPRLNVIWSSLRDDYTDNNFSEVDMWKMAQSHRHSHEGQKFAIRSFLQVCPSWESSDSYLDDERKSMSVLYSALSWLRVILRERGFLSLIRGVLKRFWLELFFFSGNFGLRSASLFLTFGLRSARNFRRLR